MQKLVIKGGRKISGTVEISGSKNATLPILASTILTNKKVVLTNIPIVNAAGAGVGAVKKLTVLAAAAGAGTAHPYCNYNNVGNNAFPALLKHNSEPNDETA